MRNGLRFTSLAHVQKKKTRSLQRIIDAEVIRVQAGHSQVHSPYAMLLPAVLNALEEAGVPYELTAQPGAGYYLRVIPRIM